MTGAITPKLGLGSVAAKGANRLRQESFSYDSAGGFGARLHCLRMVAAIPRVTPASPNFAQERPKGRELARGDDGDQTSVIIGVGGDAKHDGHLVLPR